MKSEIDSTDRFSREALSSGKRRSRGWRKIRTLVYVGSQVACTENPVNCSKMPVPIDNVLDVAHSNGQLLLRQRAVPAKLRTQRKVSLIRGGETES